MKKSINPKLVINVTLHLKEVSDTRKYRAPFFKKEGWYVKHWGIFNYWWPTTLDIVSKHYIIENRIAYSKPYVQFAIKSNSEYVDFESRVFETDEFAIEYYNKITKKYKFIKL